MRLLMIIRKLTSRILAPGNSRERWLFTNKRMQYLFSSLIMLAIILTACQPPETPEPVVETVVTQVVEATPVDVIQVVRYMRTVINLFPKPMSLMRSQKVVGVHLTQIHSPTSPSF
jgi:hypothetical protein